MPKLAIPGLMQIASPRADGVPDAPLMSQDFKVQGLMRIQSPRSEAEAITFSREGISLDSLTISYDGSPFTITDSY